MSTEDALLGCPFCDMPPTLEAWHGGAPFPQLVACANDECPASPSVTGATAAIAIRRWNTRAPTSAEGQ